MAQLPVPPNRALEALETFVFSPDQFLTEDVPLGLDPLVVAKFVQLRINRTTAVRALFQLLKVVDFYDVHEAADHLLPLLDKREPGPDAVLRSAVITRIIAIVGQPQHRDAARQYYLHLAGRADGLDVLDQLILVYEALMPDPAADPKPVADKLDVRAKALRTSTDPTARRDLQAVENSINQLQRAQRAGAIKAKVIALADRNARLDEEVKTYLTLQYGFGEFLPIWAARRLRRETWAPQPADQVKRAPDPKLREDVIAALRRALPLIDKVPHLTEPERNVLTVTDLHAIEFFGGQISDPERQFLADHGAGQKSYLRAH